MPYASIEARRAYSREYYRANPERQRIRRRNRRYESSVPPPPLPRRLNAAPLLALVDEVVMLDGRSRGEVLRAYGLEDREYFRFKEAGTVSFDTADRWVCRLGVPFGRIYPEYWEVAS